MPVALIDRPVVAGNRAEVAHIAAARPSAAKVGVDRDSALRQR